MTLDEAIRRLCCHGKPVTILVDIGPNEFWIQLPAPDNTRLAKSHFLAGEAQRAAQWLLDMADEYYPTEVSEQGAAGVSKANLEGE